METPKIGDAPETSLHFLDYWRVIRMRRSLILTVFLLVVITATATAFWILPEQFESTTRIKVQKSTPDVGVTEQSSLSMWDPYFMETEFSVIKSASILNPVITNYEGLHLVEHYSKWLGRETLTVDQACDVLHRQVNVQATRNTSLIEISVVDTDKQLAADIANAIAFTYKKSRLDEWNQVQDSGLSKFREEIETNRLEFNKLDAAVSEMRRTNQIPELGDSANGANTVLEQQLSGYMMRFQEAQSAWLHDASMWSNILQIPPDQLKGALPVIMGASSDQMLGGLYDNWVMASNKMIVVEHSGVGEKNLDYISAQVSIKTAEAMLNQKIKALTNGLVGRIASEKNEMDTQKANIELTTSTNNVQKEAWAQFYTLKKDLDNKQLILNELQQRYALENAQRHMPLSSIVTVIDPAKPVLKPVSPKKFLILVIGVLVGLGVGVGLAFFIEYLDTSVKTIDDVERALQAQVLGVIPQNVGLIKDEGAESPHAEAYRVLRTNILFARTDPNWKTISVLSGGAGEGKSTTTFNLATVFAQNGQKVIIVDSDLRRPSIHKMLRISNDVGLSNYLLKQKTLDQVIVKTGIENIDIIPSGKLPSSSLNILQSQQMKDLIQELKNRYDFVFFDSPPLLGVADASIIASQIDMALQVIQYRRYPQAVTLRAKQMVGKVGGRLLGIVLNNINMSQDENYYYYSGYYEYEYNSRSAGDGKERANGADGKVKPAGDGDTKENRIASKF